MMKSATLDSPAADAVTRAIPPPAPPPGALSLQPREIGKAAPTIDTGEYRAILCCSIGKSSD